VALSNAIGRFLQKTGDVRGKKKTKRRVEEHQRFLSIIKRAFRYVW